MEILYKVVKEYKLLLYPLDSNSELAIGDWIRRLDIADGLKGVVDTLQPWYLFYIVFAGSRAFKSLNLSAQPCIRYRWDGLGYCRPTYVCCLSSNRQSRNFILCRARCISNVIAVLG
jgi:hypothetical protein